MIDGEITTINMEDYKGKWVVLFFYPKVRIPPHARENTSFTTVIHANHSALFLANRRDHLDKMIRAVMLPSLLTCSLGLVPAHVGLHLCVPHGDHRLQ